MKNWTNMLALGRRIDKHDDCDPIGYVAIGYDRNPVVALELINWLVLALELILADNDDDGLDANDVVELDAFEAVVFVMMVRLVLVLVVIAVALLTFMCSPAVVPLVVFSSGLVAFNIDWRELPSNNRRCSPLIFLCTHWFLLPILIFLQFVWFVFDLIWFDLSITQVIILMREHIKSIHEKKIGGKRGEKKIDKKSYI